MQNVTDMQGRVACFRIEEELMELIIRKNLGAKFARRDGNEAFLPIREVEDKVRAELVELKEKSGETRTVHRPGYADVMSIKRTVRIVP